MLEILAIPCNQFGLQEPGENSEILNGLKCVRPGGGFEPVFPVFTKMDVNGKNEDKLYTYLKVNTINLFGIHTLSTNHLCLKF